MRNERKELNQQIIEFREDYRRANARLNFLLANNDTGEEYDQLERFVGYIDTMVECFPESHRKIVRLCILDDLPLTNAAAEVGYHYTWVIQLRDQAVALLEEILDGSNIIRSKRGLQVKEKMNAYYSQNDNSNSDANS